MSLPTCPGHVHIGWVYIGGSGPSLSEPELSVAICDLPAGHDDDDEENWGRRA